MISDQTDRLAKEAEVLLAAAENEKERSEEDVVTHLICSNSRHSLSNFLQAFLLQKKITIAGPVTLHNLLEQCKTIDARFESIDLSQVHCRFETHDQDYCLEANQVDTCMKAAQHARAIFRSNTPAY